MIEVSLSEDNFYYDIQGLLMAFYPGEAVVLAPAEGTDKTLRVEYAPDQVTVSFTVGGKCQWSAAKTHAADRKETKNVLKRLLYRLLSQITEKELPWGTLTGIRPTKIPMALLEEGKSEEEIARYMRETYLVSDEKNRLGIEIAKRERDILKHIDYENGYSLYIGIPFCPTTCLYCSFTSYPFGKWKERVGEYLDALFQEIDFTARAFGHKKCNTIYIGGGTPTTLPPEHMDRLLTKIEDSFSFADLQEYTVEAGRPDSITREKLKVLKSHDISRISINPQTMKDATLKLIGRRHTVAEIKEAYHMAREEGLSNINMDMILGLPEETLDDVVRTLEEIKALGPDNLTVHSLALKRAARLNMFKEQYENLHMENTSEMIDAAASSAKEMGMEPYYLYRQKNMAGNFENVGYALPGKAGIYNILMMEEKQSIVALGAGATSKAVFPGGRIERADNVKDVEQYIGRINEMIERKEKLFKRMEE